MAAPVPVSDQSGSDDSERRTEPVHRAWLFHPAADLFFVANLAWPLLFLFCCVQGTDGVSGIRFWQVYFVTTPHRWITLALVFLDRDRFRQRPKGFVGVGFAVVVICLGVRLSTGALTCLLTIDYLWNAWHFASQHHGIYRIYGRLRHSPADSAGPTVWRIALIEKVSMRCFLLYVIGRIAQWSWSLPEWDTWLSHLDWYMLAIPGVLLTRELRETRRAASGHSAFIYLLSVLGLYTSLLLAVHFRRPEFVLSLTMVSALFHAAEYLAVVTWAVNRGRSASGMIARLVPQWGLYLVIFVTVLGISSSLAESRWLNTWLLINVMVAFLHYAYDGMIWKTRRAASS